MLELEEERRELVEKIEEYFERKQYPQLRDLLLPLEAADIATICNDLDERVPIMFRLLPKELAAEVFVELDSDEQELLIQGFSNAELKEVLDELYLDDTVDIVEERPANVVKRILKHSDPETRKSINEILKYPEDSTGSIMTTEFVDLKEHMTVEDALKRIRRTAPDKETINVCYVIDDGRHLLGLLSLRTLLLAEEDDVIGDIMEPAGGGRGEPAGGHRHRGRRHGRYRGRDHGGYRADGSHAALGQAIPQDRRVRDLESPHSLAADPDAVGHLHRHHPDPL